MTDAARYRVWCLSWDECEEHGADVVAYDILNHDYESQERGVVYAPSSQISDAADAAEAYADHVYSQRDGWDATWPLTFRVRSPGGSIADFEVCCEYDPTFSASPVKTPDQKRSVA